MKRIFIISVLCTLMGLTKTMAQEAYAEFYSNKMTFYYDNNKSSRLGVTYSLDNTYWINDGNNKYTYEVEFSPSFAQARPQSTATWFRDMESLKSIKGLEFLNTEKVTNMQNMFSGCKTLTSLDLSHFKTEQVTNMSFMFSGCEALTSLNVREFNTSNVTDMKFMFQFCKSLTTLNLNNFNTEKVTGMQRMFYYCTSLTNLFVSHFNTENVTDMNNMFCHCEKLTSLDLSSFNPKNVIDMKYMFSCCNKLSQVNLTNFNTEKVTNMSYMFSDCYELTSLDLSSFNTKSVTDMLSMFSQCFSLTSLDLSAFNTINVTRMSNMFANVKKMKSINLCLFNTSKVETMSNIFAYCTELMTIYVGKEWTMSKVTDSKSMFTGCYNLVGGMGTKFDDSHTDGTYAHVDGGTSNPGYLTELIMKYNLWVGSTQVTSSNNNDILGNGKVSYNFATNTLTLEGGIINGQGTSSDATTGYGAGIYSKIDGLTIDVKNNTKVTGANGCSGMLFINNTTITGSALLTASGDKGVHLGSTSSNLTVSGNVTLEADGTTGGITGYRRTRPFENYYSTLTVKDQATVKAKGLGTLADLILEDSHAITSPTGAVWNADQNGVCDKDGKLITDKWVTITVADNRADVNRDGTVDSADIVAVIKEMPDGDKKADVNGDGAIDSADIVAVIKAMK